MRSRQKGQLKQFSANLENSLAFKLLPGLKADCYGDVLMKWRILLYFAPVPSVAGYFLLPQENIARIKIPHPLSFALGLFIAPSELRVWGISYTGSC